MKKILSIIILSLFLLIGCLNNNNEQQNNNQLDNDLNTQQSIFSNEELVFIEKNNLSVEEVSPYKKYKNFDINNYFIYEQLRKAGNTYLEAINLTIYPNYYNGYDATYYSLLIDTNLMLVNKSFRIPEYYTPNFLVSVEEYQNIEYIKRTNEVMLLDKDTLENYQQMYIDAQKNGINLLIYSGYRTYQKQYHLYYAINNQNDYYSAKPGFSEHHTGKAIDVSDSIHGLTLNFQYSNTYKWLINNAYKYGFILRYPKNKEQFTKYNYEPWHFRYVGIDIALEITNNNLTLEEYLLANIEF